MESNFNKPLPFDPHSDSSSVDQRWTKWVKKFEIYVVAADINNDIRKKALLLNLAGEEVSEIFDSLPETGATYQQALTVLNNYFKPKKNILFEIYKFRQAKQEPTETLNEFYARLRNLSATCEYENANNANNEIKIQILVGTTSESLRKKILKEGTITLESILEFGRTDEVVEGQAAALANNENVMKVRTTTINQHKKKPWKSAEHKAIPNRSCQNCGGNWHKNGLSTCPARGQACYKCGKSNHFANVCKQSVRQGSKDKQVKLVAEQSNENNSDEESYVFNINDGGSKLPTVNLNLCGIKIPFVLDTGTSSNIINNTVYQSLQNPTPLQQTTTNLFPYQSTQCLPVLGKFNTMISNEAGTNTTNARFYVIEGSSESLLSFKTATELGLINLTCSISARHSEFATKYPKLFKGIGRLKGKQAHLHIDDSIQPVAQQHRRIPFHIRKKVEEELNRLHKADIIEPVQGPTTWVSPIVVVAKPHNPDQIRICVDMRLPNTAIKRERHITPTIDDLITELNGACVFSKLDLKDGYHQLELDVQSRHITTFSTHTGLWRYKRLSFGINSAAELFQNTIRQVISGIKGAINISDDILVFGKTKEQHDKELQQTLETIQACGLTLNINKCLFGLKKVVFFGHEFSAGGVAPDKRKVQDFINMQPPKTVSEVRSLLGMINYCGRFIPNLAQLTQPLRSLIIKDKDWQWGTVEEQTFLTLKEKLTNNTTNTYFDINKHTELYVDAGPDGLGAMLTQPTKKSAGVVACSSRSLTNVEKRYSQIEKEMLAITWAVQHFKLYLEGSDFTIKTDHKPLVHLLTNPRNQTSIRLERLRLKLQGYDFIVQHCPGNMNPTDFFSRHPIGNKKTNDAIEEHVNYLINGAVPEALTREYIASETIKDTTLQKLTVVINSQKELTWADPVIERFSKIRYELSVAHDGIITRGNRIVIPSSLQQNIIELAHKGHQGVVKTKKLLREKVWFPDLDKMVETRIKSCIPCQATITQHTRTPIISTPLPSNPWESLAMDFAGPFPNGKYVMVILDEFSRFPVVEVIKSLKATKIINHLNRIFGLFGIPTSLKTDNGPPFNGSEFKIFLKSKGCKHRAVTPLWPEANGNVERFMKTIKRTIQTAVIENLNWEGELHQFLMNYRSTPHSTTEIPPYDALFKRRVRTTIPIIDTTPKENKIRDKDAKNKEKNKNYADKQRHTRPHELQLHDKVLVKQKPTNKYSPPYNPNPFVITNVAGNAVTIQRDRQQLIRNSSLLKKLEGDQCKTNTTNETTLQSDDNTPVSGTEEPPQNDPKSENQERTQVIPRRSGRTIRRPSRFEDYEIPTRGDM